MTTISPIRVAIVGGGLGGSCLANALLAHPHLDVQVYEGKPAFSERGASIGLHQAAQKALSQVFTSEHDLYAKAGAVQSHASIFALGSGPLSGQIISEMAGSKGWIVQRSSLLRELLAPLPQNILHSNKKVVSMTELSNKQMRLNFEDGAAEVFDAIIGADGVFSTVRKFIHGDSAQEHAASAAGFWDSRNLVSKERVLQVIGDEYFLDDRQYGWLGDKGFIMHDVAENGSIVQCVLCMVQEQPPKNRKRSLTREYLTSSFQAWMDGPIAPGMIELTLEQPSPSAYSQFEHKTTPTYARANACVMGDAAHAMTPWMASGAATAFEDAMILGHLFGSVFSREDIAYALRSYDEVRRPRCQSIIDASLETGYILCGLYDGVGLNPGKLLRALEPRWGLHSQPGRS